MYVLDDAGAVKLIRVMRLGWTGWRPPTRCCGRDRLTGAPECIQHVPAACAPLPFTSPREAQPGCAPGLAVGRRRYHLSCTSRRMTYLKHRRASDERHGSDAGEGAVRAYRLPLVACAIAYVPRYDIKPATKPRDVCVALQRVDSGGVRVGTTPPSWITTGAHPAEVTRDIDFRDFPWAVAP